MPAQYLKANQLRAASQKNACRIQKKFGEIQSGSIFAAASEKTIHAGMAELVDAHVSGACAFTGMRVRVSLPALSESRTYAILRKSFFFFFLFVLQTHPSDLWHACSLMTLRVSLPSLFHYNLFVKLQILFQKSKISDATRHKL